MPNTASGPALVADWLPWAGLIAPGVVLNKDGSFRRTARFRGPDLDSATQGELISTSARLNNALRRLGSGRAQFIEAERRPPANYPQSEFPEPLSWLEDEERRAAFDDSGNHFESGYHLTLVNLPAEESRARAAGLLYENRPTEGVDWRERLTAFVVDTDRIFDLLDGVMPEIAWLDDSQTLTYLHATVSTRRYREGVPEVPFHLDALLADAPLIGGLAPMLGDQHVRVATVRGFPTSTWPGILDDLNRLGFAYRWSTRFLCLDKSDAEKELARLRRQWVAKRKNIIALLRETIFQQESALVDTDASNKASDADAALQELGSDQVAFGYVTATVTVLDADAAVADEKLRRVERVTQGRGFVTIPETLNTVDAWLSSIPGHAYANVRQPIVSTLNLAHLMPVSALWAGPEKNAHLDGPPLIVTRTEGATPFRLVTHIGDVGHTLVAVPTGMGKSVLLATLAMQFLHYRGSRIFAFDMGRSMRATILGLGGEQYDLGMDGEIAFQPLARIHREGYRTWAAEWIEGRLRYEGVAVGPEESFSRAAEELFVTHSAVSHQIRALEGDLGTALFTREGRRLTLTAPGKRYAEQVRAALSSIAAASEALRSDDRERRLVVSLLPSFAARWLTPRVGRLIERCPELDLELQSTHTLTDFSRDDVDAVIRLGDGNYPELFSEHLFDESFFPACAPGLNGGRLPVEPRELADMRLLRNDYQMWTA